MSEARYNSFFRSLLVLVASAFILHFSLLAQDGTLDPSFGTGGKYVGTSSNALAFGTKTAIAIQPDGKIITGGTFQYASWAFGVMRFTANGTLDQSFGALGARGITFPGASTSALYALALQTDGRILVAGYMIPTGGKSKFAVARLTTDGIVDQTFGTAGLDTISFGAGPDEAYALAVQPDGKILVGGITTQNAQADFALIRLQSNGALDTQFGTNGKVITDYSGNWDRGQTIKLQTDGKILLGGRSNNGTDDDFAIARYTTTGALDQTFGTSGKVRTNIAVSDLLYGLAVLPDGKIVAAGRSMGTLSNVALVKYKVDGTLDVTFGSNGVVTYSPATGSSNYVYDLLVQGDGKLLVAGYTSVPSKQDDYLVCRFTSSGTIDGSFGTNGSVIIDMSNNVMDDGMGIAQTADGKTIVVGMVSLPTGNVVGLAKLTSGSTGGVLPGEYLADGSTVLLLHMNETSGQTASDASTYANHGTTSGTTIVPGKFGSARNFNGSSDYIRANYAASLNSTQQMTLEGWAYLRSYRDHASIITKGTTNGVYSLKQIGGKLTLHIGDQQASSFIVTGNTNLPLNKWVHLAAARLGTTVKLYVNGVIDKDTSISIGGLGLNNTEDLTVGVDFPGNAEYFDGFIDEVRISTTVRLPQEFGLQLPPISITASSSGSSVILNWQNGGGAIAVQRYKIYRGTDSTNVSLIDSTTSASYTNSTGLQSGTRYFYRVTTVDVTGFEGARSYAANATVGTVGPPPGGSTGTKSPFSDLVLDISEVSAKTVVRYHQSLASSSYLHVVWCEADTLDSGTYRKLAYRRSTDGGRTYEAKSYLGSLTRIGDPRGTQYAAADGSYIHIIILDYPPSTDPVGARLLYFRSTDNGATFESQRQIWSLPPNHFSVGDYAVAASNGNVNIFSSWRPDTGSGTPYVMSYNSKDNGATFTASTITSVRPKEGYYWWWLFSDAMSQGSNFYALASDFNKTGNYEQLTFMRSTNGGSSFSFTPISIANTSASLPDLQWTYSNSQEVQHSKKISAENSDVHIIWEQKDVGANSYDLFYRLSADGGATFGQIKKLTASLTKDDVHVGASAIATKGNYVYVTYNYASTGYWRIGLYYSKDKGSTFSFTSLMNDTLFYAQDGRNAIPMIDPASNGDQVIIAYCLNQSWNQNVNVTRFNATTGQLTRKYYFPTSDMSYQSAPLANISSDGSINVIIDGIWPGAYAPRRLYSLVIEKEKAQSADNYALRFDHNSSGYIYEDLQIPYGPNLNLTSALTIEGWIKKLSTGQILIAGKRGQGQDYYYYLGVSQNTNYANPKHPFASITTTTQKYDLSAYMADSVWMNKWQHLAMTYDANAGANNFKLYLNGKVVDSTTATGSLVSGPGCIFVNHMPSNWWGYPMGSVLYDELRIWNKARTINEINSSMSAPLQGTESGLVAYYPLNGSLKEAAGKGEDAILNYTGSYERTSFPSLATGVATSSPDLPARFELDQNYPNPFNPSTIIPFSLATRMRATLKVYDLLGRELATLIDEEMSAGRFSVVWDAGRFSSGVYFYRLTAGNFAETRRLVLLK